MLGSFDLIRTNAAHIGSSAIVSSVASNSEVKEGTDGKKKVTGSFENYLMDAVNYVNGKQISSTENVEKMITDPDSIDIHDVTIAMAEASMSLSLAQTVIDRLVSGWNEITTTR
ncbi:MAG: flagellar hook-basal body complex protein FliE [Spirochaetaceae bacterium]|nr:flagellar hook-basal body complex protein FliE [Spirochaetaceae bacterium]